MKKTVLTLFAFVALTAADARNAFATETESKILDLKTYAESGSVSLYYSAYKGMPIPARLINDQLFIKGSNSIGLVDFWRIEENLNESVSMEEESHVVVHLGKNAGIEVNVKPLRVEGVAKEQLQKVYYPLRDVFELSGYLVRYDAETQSIKITK